MTRIVAGVAGGRQLRVPSRGTRPTSERAREGLFNALGAAGRLAGARVLDLYAGSGAHGLEALSRGAADACFVESDRRAIKALRGNVAAVGLGGTIRQGKVEDVLAMKSAAPFDLVLADPPYALAGVEVVGVLSWLASRGWIAPGGLAVVERALRDGDFDWPSAYTPIRTMRYGDTVLHWGEYRS